MSRIPHGTWKPEVPRFCSEQYAQKQRRQKSADKNGIVTPDTTAEARKPPVMCDAATQARTNRKETSAIQMMPIPKPPKQPVRIMYQNDDFDYEQSADLNLKW